MKTGFGALAHCVLLAGEYDTEAMARGIADLERLAALCRAMREDIDATANEVEIDEDSASAIFSSVTDNTLNAAIRDLDAAIDKARVGWPKPDQVSPSQQRSKHG